MSVNVYNTPGADGGSRNAASRSMDIDVQYAYYSDAPGGPAQVAPGTLLQSGSDETWTFVGVGRKAYGNSSGRVTVEAACEDCDHFWHPNGIETREFFPHVFGLYLGDAEGNEV